ncbi:MAG: 4Fe-4S binding protein [bacterium]|nr:4Fe-4S binding protein [bacterium]
MNITKIIFGAKNTDIENLKKLVRIYSLAGADVFDVCADSEVIANARKVIDGLDLVKKPIVCASITLSNDKHANKAEIIKDKCCGCTRCINICPQKTIVSEKNIAKVKTDGCVGCGKCLAVCPNSAIKMYNLNQSFETQFLQAKSADCIEIHTNGKDQNLYEIFEFLKQNYDGKIGICISQNTDTQEKIKIITKCKDIISPKKLIVQADGNSISGFDNEIKTTQKAIEESKNFQNIDNITLIASGGTNFKTAELAKAEKVRLDGIAWGSFARKIIFDNENDTEENKLKKAKELIGSLFFE